MLAIVGAMAFIPDQRAPLVFGIVSVIVLLVAYALRRSAGARARHRGHDSPWRSRPLRPWRGGPYSARASSMRLLVFNAGSSSLKFDLMDATAGGPVSRLKTGSFVDTADGSGQFELRIAEPGAALPAPIRSLSEAASFVLDWLSNTLCRAATS